MILAQRVRARAHMKRLRGGRWEREELPAPVEGLVTAQRNRVQMEEDWEYPEYGKSYVWRTFGEQFKAYDVTFSLHRRPLVVLPDDLEVLDG